MTPATSAAAFLARYGALFEHSLWVVERAAARAPFADLHAGLMAVVHDASPDEQLALIRAHPELAGKAALDRTLTDASAAEQASAGLDRLTPQEYERFHALNAAYGAKFGFPFIVCVRLTDKAGILAAMQARLDNDRPTEIATAIQQIGEIVRLRLHDIGLAELEARVAQDLGYLNYPEPDWLTPRPGVHDVVIVGGGQSGLGAAFALKLARIANILVIDENPAGYEGPWDTYARMQTLRTPKHLTAIDMGVPSLTFRAWYEAQHGAAAWDALGKIPRRTWMAYLRWYRRVLDLPVRNGAKLELIEPVDGIHTLHLADGSTIRARKVILATGIQGGGHWHTPDMVQALPRSRYAHTSEPIDYAALAGKRVAILGGGASAFDNASTALEAGVAAAEVFIRRKELPRINVIRFMESAGMIQRYPALSDADKYAVMASFWVRNQPPTTDMFERAAAHPGFDLHLGSPWLSVKETPDGVRVETPQGTHLFDFLVLSTGLVTDPALRPELARVQDRIARWGDRITAPAEIANPVIDAHPYLGPAFEFLPRTPDDARALHGLFAFNYSALISLGLSAAALSGLKHALPRLVSGVADQLFRDDEARMLADYAEYAELEFVAEWPRAVQKAAE
jgi:OHCU decarboxylase